VPDDDGYDEDDGYDAYDDDAYEDFLEMFKKHFKIDSDMFDVDFLFIPEPNNEMDKIPRNNDLKGFKISYHFEPGMDKPEVRIDGDLDEKKLHEYFKSMRKSGISRIRGFKSASRKIKDNKVDISGMSLTLPSDESDNNSIEPFAEVHVQNKALEIILEVPGIEKGHLLLSLSENGKNLKISGESELRTYIKSIELPFKVTLDDYQLDLNNGIATITVNRKY
jgi:HSP20 family molecular chaperone IbpA